MLYKFIDKNTIEEQPISLAIGDKRVFNPNEIILRENGYKDLIISPSPSKYYDFEYVDGTSITMAWTKWSTEKRTEYYPVLVSSLIRERYSLDDEFALLRQRDEKTEEFEAYNQYAEQCKEEAKKELEI